MESSEYSTLKNTQQYSKEFCSQKVETVEYINQICMRLSEGFHNI